MTQNSLYAKTEIVSRAYLGLTICLSNCILGPTLDWQTSSMFNIGVVPQKDENIFWYFEGEKS